VPAGKAENIIGFSDHFRRDLSTTLVCDIDAQFLHRRDRMHAGRRAIDRAQARRQCFKSALLFIEFAENAFGHRAAADITRADKEDLFHSQLDGRCRLILQRLGGNIPANVRAFKLYFIHSRVGAVAGSG